MMENFLIAEGDADIILIRHLIEENGVLGPKYIAAGGWSSADSLARSVLTNPNTKVAIIVDADSSDPNLIEERNRFLRRSLGQIADKARWRVIVIAPEIERILFDNRNILEELVQQKVSDADFIEGQYNPKKVLQRIAGTPTNKLFERLSNINLEPLQNMSSIKEVRQFFGVRHRKAAA